MPTRALTICRAPGCSALAQGSYCPRHAGRRTLAARENDQRRESSVKRGYGRRHQRWRKMILARDPLCKIAALCDGTAPSMEADHIIPLSRGGDWSMENGQGACQRCHSWKTRKEQAEGG